MACYTAVGSREAPLKALRQASLVAYILFCLGYTVRSGAAPGMDSSFEMGVTDQPVWHHEALDIYLPWPGFEGRPNHSPYCVAHTLPNYHAAEAIASEVHPVWERLTQGPRKLHTRNVYQVLGRRLIDPSEFLVCWARVTSSGNIAGGTATAVTLARQFRITVFNLYLDEDVDRLEIWLNYLISTIPNSLPDDIVDLKAI